MNNPFHAMGVVAICALVSAGVSWGSDLSDNQVPSTLITVYPPTPDTPSYNVVITQSSNVVMQTYHVVVPQ